MVADVTAEVSGIAPGSVVIVRDEEWLVTKVEPTNDGRLLSCRGLSELVRDTTASFYDRLDRIEALDPAEAVVVPDDSPHYRRSRLWLEATLRKTAVPLDGAALTVSTDMLADSLGYQQAAVRKALDPANLRTRILLADAVGLGKTLEIGMILSELIRRGRGERILVVTTLSVMTGFTFLSRLTQIAPPCTRYVFLGAGFRLGLPSHPASRRRSRLRLGVSITSSSRFLQGTFTPKRSPMPGVLKYLAAYAARLRGHQDAA